ncbi:hypothetical protein TNCV_3070461 [Trichonephila clavipes]|nr:hypothetical protein TNCV_3070461 [Trichonephila clavipes]
MQFIQSASDGEADFPFTYLGGNTKAANHERQCMSERGPRNSTWQGARSTPVVRPRPLAPYRLGEIPKGTIDGTTTYLHLHNFAMELDGREYSPVPCSRDSAHKTFGPTDLTSTFSVCTRRVFGGIGHRTQTFWSGVRCPNH